MYSLLLSAKEKQFSLPVQTCSVPSPCTGTASASEQREHKHIQ